MLYNLKDFNIEVNIEKIANIHYFEFLNNYHTNKDKHDFCELIYVDSGKITIEAENFNGVLSQNQFVIHKPNEVHSLSCDEQGAPNIIIIGFKADCKELDAFSFKKTTLSSDLQRPLVEVVKESRNVFMPPYDIPNLADMKKYSYYPFGADQLIKNLLEYFFIKLIRSQNISEHLEQHNTGNTSNDKSIIEIRSYLDKNYKEKQSLKELCLLFCMNKTTLCSQFKKQTGFTIIEYINKLKIKEAKILMREGKNNFTQISEYLNFSSVHYFSKLFTQIEHVTPTNYIKSIKAKLNQ